MNRLAFAATFAGLLIATPALADPCKAIPDDGPAPAWLQPGSTFSGAVAYVGDGDMVCVQARPGAAGLVEVRLEDFYSPELRAPGGREAKAALERIAMGRRVTCRAGRQSYDRVVALCTLDGVSLGDRMRRAGIREGGNGR